MGTPESWCLTLQLVQQRHEDSLRTNSGHQGTIWTCFVVPTVYSSVIAETFIEHFLDKVQYLLIIFFLEKYIHQQSEIDGIGLHGFWVSG